MRLVVISDTHTLHGAVEPPPGDVLVHAGDFSLGGQPREVEAFFAWFASRPHAHKVVIAGNHDLLFESSPDLARDMVPGNVIYLEDSGCTISGVRIWGSPWQPWFLDWAFNLATEAERQAKWDLIPRDTDVLLTHGPPLGILDECYDGRRVGCAALARTVREINPALHLFGHIHESYGRAVDPTGQSGTTFVNACICDQVYRPANPPVVVDMGASRDS